MIVKERIQELIKDNFYVDHKALGKTQMHENLDYQRRNMACWWRNSIRFVYLILRNMNKVSSKVR